MRSSVLLLLAAVGLGGCASVLTPDNRTSLILVTTSCGPVENVGARCVLSSGQDSTAFDAPAEIRVKNSWTPLLLECRGDLLGSTSELVTPRPNLGLAGNLFLGGVPGVLIDAATGRGFNYDRHINVHRPSCFR